jgi:hypothetical protein
MSRSPSRKARVPGRRGGGLFGLPVLPPVGGGEHLPALLPDLPRFRPWVSGTDSRGGEMQDCQGTGSTALLSRSIALSAALCSNTLDLYSHVSSI